MYNVMVHNDVHRWDIPFYVIGSVVIIFAIKNKIMLPETPKEKGIIIEENTSLMDSNQERVTSEAEDDAKPISFMKALMLPG